MTAREARGESGPGETVASSGFRISHVPALDGFRVLAIVPVLFIHSGASFMIGGALGVDLFFALSGFLITSLLLRDIADNGRVRLGRFWLRRARRLVPALSLVVCFVVACTFVVPDVVPPGPTYREALAALFYVTNWTRVTGTTQEGLLNHTWSLAIEEQYYFLWPLLLTWLVRISGTRRRLAAVVAVMACGFAAWRALAFAQGTDVQRLYNGLDTRADSLLIGSTLAIVVTTDAYERLMQHRTAVRVAAYVALVVLLCLAVVMPCHAPFMYDFGYFLVPTCAAIVIASIVTNVHDSTYLLNRWLSWPGMRWFGQVSYGIYLWHVPIYRLMGEFGYRGRWQITVGTALTVALAALSYYTVEAYFRKFNHDAAPAQQRREETPTSP